MWYIQSLNVPKDLTLLKYDGKTVTANVKDVTNTVPYSSTVNIDWSNSDYQTVVLTGNITLTFSNAQDGGY